VVHVKSPIFEQENTAESRATIFELSESREMLLRCHIVALLQHLLCFDPAGAAKYISGVTSVTVTTPPRRLLQPSAIFFPSLSPPKGREIVTVVTGVTARVGRGLSL
jgi:hypothetical protein